MDAMDTDRLLRELTDFLRIPSVSTSASHNADCRAAAEWVAGELRRLGCREVQFLASDTHPVVWGVGREVPGAPTLLIYGHYDVQPPEPLDEWTTPPFEPTVRDGKLFARGAADDKGQVFCLLKAIETAGGRGVPPVNFRFLIEGEEEHGSRVLFELLRREPERTRADAVLIADMAYVAPGWPAVGAPRPQAGLRARAAVGAADLRDPRHHRRIHRRRREDRDPGGGDGEGEPAARPRSEAQDRRAPARRRGETGGAQVRAGARHLPPRRGPRDREGDAP